MQRMLEESEDLSSYGFRVKKLRFLLDVQEVHYTVTAEDGSPITSGGGVVMEADGSTRPVTEDEVLAHLDQPDLYHKEDGAI